MTGLRSGPPFDFALGGAPLRRGATFTVTFSEDESHFR